jgi:hypothetical protein
MPRIAIAISLLMAGIAPAAANLSPAKAPPATEAPQEMAPVFHNGSRAIFTRSGDGHVEIRYDAPRQGLPVQPGTLLFSGTYDTKHELYSGVAYIFKRGCEPTPYPVAGTNAGPGIVLIGAAPRRDPHSCAILGATLSGENARLVFEYERE